MLVNNSTYQILTPFGFKDFLGVRKTTKECIKITHTGGEITVSIDHRFIINEQTVTASSLQIGDSLGDFSVVSIESVGEKDVFDPLEVEDWNVYIAGDLQHHNCEFCGSTNTVVSTDRLEYLLTQVSSPISTELQNRFRIFEFPQENQQYIIGVDVAKGTGEHSSCIQILKLKSMKPLKLKQVAAFEDNYTDIYMFAEIINRIGTYYNKAFVVLENNAEGAGVVNRLWWDYGYENLVNEGEKSTKLGVRATRATKPKAVLLMKKLIEDLCLELPDESTVNQLLSFIDDGKGHFRGNDGAPDDLISALYWACYTMEFDLFESKATVIVEADGVPEEVWGILVGFDSPTGDDNWL